MERTKERSSGREKFNRSLNRSFGKKAKRTHVAVFRPSIQILQSRNKELALNLELYRLEARDLTTSVAELQKENVLLNGQIITLKEQVDSKKLNLNKKNVDVLRVAILKLMESVELVSQSISGLTNQEVQPANRKDVITLKQNDNESRMDEKEAMLIDDNHSSNDSTEKDSSLKKVKKQRKCCFKLSTPKALRCFKSPRPNIEKNNGRSKRAKNICYKEPPLSRKLRRGDTFFSELTTKVEMCEKQITSTKTE